MFDSKTKPLLEDLVDKHREIKKMMLDLITKSEQPNISKAKLQDEIFKIYMELK